MTRNDHREHVVKGCAACEQGDARDKEMFLLGVKSHSEALAARWRSGYCVECGEKWPCTAVTTNSDRKVPHRLAAPTEEERQHEA